MRRAPNPPKPAGDRRVHVTLAILALAVAAAALMAECAGYDVVRLEQPVTVEEWRQRR